MIITSTCYYDKNKKDRDLRLDGGLSKQFAKEILQSVHLVNIY